MVASDRAISLAKKVLAKCMAYDPHFPRPSEATLLAWGEHISYRNPDPDDMLEAVTKFYETNTDAKPLPASITFIARQVRQERAMHGDYKPPPDKSDDPEPQLPVGKKISMAEWEELHGAKFPKLALGLPLEEPNAQLDGPNPLRVQCPHCQATPGSQCTIPGTTMVLTKSRAHDARYAVVEGRCAPGTKWHVDPHSEDCELA